MKFTQPMGRMMSDRRARQVVGFAGVLALISIAQPALADGTAIETGLGTIKTWMTTVASVVGVIAIMAVGYAKLTGRMDWGTRRHRPDRYRHHLLGSDDRRLDGRVGLTWKTSSPRIRSSSP